MLTATACLHFNVSMNNVTLNLTKGEILKQNVFFFHREEMELVQLLHMITPIQLQFTI